MTSIVQCSNCDSNISYDHGDTGNLVQHLQDYHRYVHMDPSSSKQVDEPSHGEAEIENSYTHDHHDCLVRDAIDQAVGSLDNLQDAIDKNKYFDNPLALSSLSLSSEEELASISSRDTFHQKLIVEAPADRKPRTLYERTYIPRRPLRCYRGVSYRAMVESWRPGNKKITCPVCGKTRIPVLRTHREQETGSSLWATILLCCGSFFCLPCCFPGPRQEFMHCSTCDAFLAVYDYDQDCLHPNFDQYEPG